MAYQVKKSSKIIEDLELLNDNNEFDLTIHVEIDVDKIAKEFRQKQVEVMNAQELTKNKDEKALEAYGKAIISFFECIFGTENTETLLKYFDNKYSDMAIQCVPFINDIVSPAIQHAVQLKRQQIANNYNMSRSQKRKLGIK